MFLTGTQNKLNQSGYRNPFSKNRSSNLKKNILVKSKLIKSNNKSVDNFIYKNKNFRIKNKNPISSNLIKNNLIKHKIKISTNNVTTKDTNIDIVDISQINNKITKSNYKFHIVIGVGGFGKVWICEERKSKKFYAIKEISKKK